MYLPIRSRPPETGGKYICSLELNALKQKKINLLQCVRFRNQVNERTAFPLISTLKAEFSFTVYWGLFP
jgi:hypothetical protein